MNVAQSTPVPASVAPLSGLVGRLRRAGAMPFMPYFYVLVLGGLLVGLQSTLLFGPGAIDARAAAVVPLALVAFGQTLAILTRGIDLSVGSVVSMATAVAATAGNHTGTGLILELILILLGGAAIGAINGLLIAVGGMQPFIVTLASWSVWGGVALLILPVEGGEVPLQLTEALVGSFFGIPKSVWALAVLFAFWSWLRNTSLLQDLRAIGSDEDRARLLGVNLVRRKVAVYMVCSAFAALAGIWLAGETAAGAPTVGNQFVLISIAGVVIGGSSIFGGTGSAAGTMVGCIALLMIPDVIFALHLASYWATFFQGALLVVAVVISSLAVRFRKGGA